MGGLGIGNLLLRSEALLAWYFLLEDLAPWRRVIVSKYRSNPFE